MVLLNSFLILFYTFFGSNTTPEHKAVEKIASYLNTQASLEIGTIIHHDNTYSNEYRIVINNLPYQEPDQSNLIEEACSNGALIFLQEVPNVRANYKYITFIINNKELTTERRYLIEDLRQIQLLLGVFTEFITGISQLNKESIVRSTDPVLLQQVSVDTLINTFTLINNQYGAPSDVVFKGFQIIEKETTLLSVSATLKRGSFVNRLDAHINPTTKKIVYFDF